MKLHIIQNEDAEMRSKFKIYLQFQFQYSYNTFNWK